MQDKLDLTRWASNVVMLRGDCQPQVFVDAHTRAHEPQENRYRLSMDIAGVAVDAAIHETLSP